jgi:P-type E1-E2 ATPase
MIVAIPEGLPLSIQLAMSFSVSKLKQENILIKNMNAIQKMAMCHEVCISKTGCLTTGEMFVDKY